MGQPVLGKAWRDEVDDALEMAEQTEV